MINLKQDFDALTAVAKTYRVLKARFDEFARYVEEEAGDPSSMVRGIGVELQLDQRFFVVKWCDRSITLELTASCSDIGITTGKVVCYQHRAYPKPELIEVGHFTFTSRGTTDQSVSPDNDQLCLDNRSDAITLVWHYLLKSFTN